MHQQLRGDGVLQVADVGGASNETIHIYAGADVVIHGDAHQLVRTQWSEEVVNHFCNARAHDIVVLALVARLKSMQENTRVEDQNESNQLQYSICVYTRPHCSTQKLKL